MPNKFWNNHNKDQKTDNVEGAKGKGKAISPKLTYGNNTSFKTGLTDTDSESDLAMHLSSPPKVGKWKSGDAGFGTHKNK